MSLRLNVLAITTILLVLLLLVNSQRVQFQFFFITTHVSLGGVMAFCIAIGVGLTFLFLSLGRSYKKLLHRVKKHMKATP